MGGELISIDVLEDGVPPVRRIATWQHPDLAGRRLVQKRFNQSNGHVEYLGSCTQTTSSIISMWSMIYYGRC